MNQNILHKTGCCTSECKAAVTLSQDLLRIKLVKIPSRKEGGARLAQPPAEEPLAVVTCLERVLLFSPGMWPLDGANAPENGPAPNHIPEALTVLSGFGKDDMKLVERKVGALEGIKRGVRQNQNILILGINFSKNKQYLYRFPEVALQAYASVLGASLTCPAIGLLQEPQRPLA